MQLPWRKAETDLDREIRYHIETLADTFEKEGMTRAAALRRARAEFGGVDQVKDECRDESVWNWPTQFVQDLRFGWRMLRKTPSITIAAVASLALGIGATSVILSLADIVLWKTLPVPSPEHLTELHWEAKADPEGLVTSSSGSNFRDGALSVADFFSFPAYQRMKEQTNGKARIAAHIYPTAVSSVMAGRVAVAQLRGVSGNFFSVLQLQPSAGRLLSDNDDDPATPLAAVVSHRFWQRQLGADPALVGQTIRINNSAYSLAGILPADFQGIVPGDDTDLYTSIQHSPQFLRSDSWYRRNINNPLSWWLQLLARRAPGVSEQELRMLTDTAFASSFAAAPKSLEATPHIRTVPAARGLGDVRRSFGDPLRMLLILVGMVLVVACANIANLLLARAVHREKEVALRVSLGCSQSRLIRQFFAESLMLAALGGVCSIAVAELLGLVVVGLLPFGGNTLSLHADTRSLTATAVITVLTAILFGFYPAIRAARTDTSPALKEGTGSAGTLSRSRWLPARLLVLVQVSLGVLLVTAAILFTSRLNEIVNRDAGFERGHVLLFDVRPGELNYQGDRLRQFYTDLEARLNDLPGVEVAGLSGNRPMRGGGRHDQVSVPGNNKPVGVAVHHATPGFLPALGVPILAGRGITPQEVQSGAKVAVIGEDVAQALGLSSPLGARFVNGKIDYTIVGIARRAQYARLTQSRPVIYLPPEFQRQSLTAIVRTTVPPMAVLPGVRKVVSDLNRDLPLVDVYTMEQQISRTLQRERLFAWLCGGFGVLALVLCIVGLYGLMSHTTARRTPEIGIRMALGASRGDVLTQVLRDGMALALFGLILGVPVALYGAHLAQTQRLIPEGPVPYWTLASAIGVLAFSAFIAVLAPATRASSIDPIKALWHS